MTALDALNALQEFLKTNVAEKIKLQKEPGQDELPDPTKEKSYVHPSVPLIHMAHKNFDPAGYRVPFLSVMFDSDDDDDGDRTMSIRLVGGVYGGGNYAGDIDPEGIPDNQGYLDLLNLLEKAKTALLRETVIGGASTVRKPVRMQMYDDADTWPYWYGSLTFDVALPPAQAVLDDEESED